MDIHTQSLPSIDNVVIIVAADYGDLGATALVIPETTDFTSTAQTTKKQKKQKKKDEAVNRKDN